MVYYKKISHSNIKSETYGAYIHEIYREVISLLPYLYTIYTELNLIKTKRVVHKKGL